MRTAALAVTLVFALAARAAAAGQTTLNFLTLDTGARPVALGGAVVAEVSGPNSLRYNPAGLARSDRDEVSVMHNEYVEGVRQEHASYASPLGWGAGVEYLDSGAVPRTTVSNPDGAGLGDAGLSDLAASLGYGRLLGPVALGASASFLRESIDGIAAQTVAFDAGAQLELPKVPGLRLGAALLHAGPDVRFVADKQPLPVTVAGGASYAFQAGAQRVTFSAEARDERGGGLIEAGGAELAIHGTIALRVGYSSQYDAGPGLTAGFGWRGKNAQIDYAVVPLGDLGLANRLSANLRWGPTSEERQTQARLDRKYPRPQPISFGN